MSAEIQAVKFAEINSRAEQEKATADYIIQLITDNESALLAAYEIEAIDDSALIDLYNKVEATLMMLNRDHTKRTGVNIFWLSCDDVASHRIVEPAHSMGWTRYAPGVEGIEDVPMDKPFLHLRSLTDLGSEIVNGFRFAQGKTTTAAEQRQINTDEFDQALKRHAKSS